MARSGDEGLEQRLDRWVSAGRQFVDGVSGARPGSRGTGRAMSRRSGSRLNPAELGRWVEHKLDWLLDEEPADDWREPWQAQSQSRPQLQSQPRGRRRPLEAISRRPAAPALSSPGSAAPAEPAGDWPDDELFSVPRWQRQPQPQSPAVEPESAAPPRQVAQGRPLPRSSRRR